GHPHLLPADRRGRPDLPRPLLPQRPDHAGDARHPAAVAAADLDAGPCRRADGAGAPRARPHLGRPQGEMTSASPVDKARRRDAKCHHNRLVEAGDTGTGEPQHSLGGFHMGPRIRSLLLGTAVAAGVALGSALAAEEKVVNVYNWSDYIGEHTIADFE